jgi:hypothetical protein
MLAIDRGLDCPGGDEVMESLETLSAQITGAKHDFMTGVRSIGFAAG